MVPSSSSVCSWSSARGSLRFLVSLRWKRLALVPGWQQEWPGEVHSTPIWYSVSGRGYGNKLRWLVRLQSRNPRGWHGEGREAAASTDSGSRERRYPATWRTTQQHTASQRGPSRDPSSGLSSKGCQGKTGVASMGVMHPPRALAGYVGGAFHNPTRRNLRGCIKTRR